MKKTLSTLIGLLIVFSSVLFFSHNVSAQGEVYNFGGTTDDNGGSGSEIKASGGAYRAVTTFKKISQSQVDENLWGYTGTVTYTAYYLSNGFGLATEGLSNPDCNSAPVIIALEKATSTKGVIYAPGGSSCGNDIGFDIARLHTNTMSHEISVRYDPLKIARFKGYTEALSNPHLNALRTDFFNNRCSGMGCEQTWYTYVGSCWENARNAVTEAQREANRANTLGGNVSIDVNSIAKISFANCLSGKLGGVPPAVDIRGMIEDVDYNAINQAGESSQSEEQTRQDDIVSPTSDPETTCAIDGIGWLVCPTVNFLAGIADSSFAFLADTFLRTDPQVFNTTPDNKVFLAWSAVRNIANVAFVIVFLIIIFSQITSVGVSNYGVKKMLPRLVVAAILVNISFFISQLAIDISNILGYSIRDAFAGVAGDLKLGADTPTNALNAGNGIGGNTGGGFLGIAGTVLTIGVGAGLAYAALSSFLPLLLAAVLALVMILFILIARQAAIVLLVVLSPLAFVAFLLPNTENLFKQWRKMFTGLLLLFPIIAIVFGASSLASVVLTETFQDSGNIMGQVIGAAILVLPLFAVPVLLKKSMDGIPVLGQQIGKLAGRATGSFGKATKESYGNSIMGMGSAARKQNRQNTYRANTARRLQRGGFVGGVGNVMAGGLGGLVSKKQRQAVTAMASSIVASQEAEELKTALQALTRELSDHKAKGGDGDAFLTNKIANSKSATEREAAMHQAAALGRTDLVRGLMSSTSGGDRAALQRAIDTNAGSLIGKAPDIIKGTKAFESFTGADMAQWDKGTAAAYAKHVESLHAAGETARLQNSLNSLAASTRDVGASADLQAKLSGETGISLRDGVTAAGAATGLPLSGMVSRIDSTGKIR